MSAKLDPSERSAIQQDLADWSTTSLRDLPWRRTRDPWSILVIEVMSQQTQIDRVLPKWQAFIDRWPDPSTFAATPLDEVLVFWKGLGYPRRARWLWMASATIVEHGFPETEAALLALPGIGPYTASAVRCFGFEHDVAVVDTNIGRVLARVTDSRLSVREVRSIADSLVPDGRSWAHNSALMDLGATICTARRPNCSTCPVSSTCRWFRRGCSDPDPSVRSAGVSTTQPRFEGSDRQRRGRILALLGEGPASERALVDALSARGDSAAHTATPIAIRQLCQDGLVSAQVNDEMTVWSLAKA